MESLETIYTVQHKRYVEVDVAMIEIVSQAFADQGRRCAKSAKGMLQLGTPSAANKLWFCSSSGSAVPLVLQYPKPVE